MLKLVLIILVRDMYVGHGKDSDPVVHFRDLLQPLGVFGCLNLQVLCRWTFISDGVSLC